MSRIKKLISSGKEASDQLHAVSSSPGNNKPGIVDKLLQPLANSESAITAQNINLLGSTNAAKIVPHLKNSSENIGAVNIVLQSEALPGNIATPITRSPLQSCTNAELEHTHPYQPRRILPNNQALPHPANDLPAFQQSDPVPLPRQGNFSQLDDQSESTQASAYKSWTAPSGKSRGSTVTVNSSTEPSGHQPFPKNQQPKNPGFSRIDTEIEKMPKTSEKFMYSNVQPDYMLAIIDLAQTNARTAEANARAAERLAETNTTLTQENARIRQLIEARDSTILQLSELLDVILPAMQERIFSMRQEIIEPSRSHGDENLQQIFYSLLEVTKLAMERKQIIDQSRNTYIGRDLNAEGGSNVTFGDVTSSELKTLIGQLPDSIEQGQQGIRTLLAELEQAIEEEAELSTSKKAVLREEVQALIEAYQTNEPEKKAGLIQHTKEMFSVMLKGLPPTAAIVESCSKLLPQILKILGFPA